MYISMISARSPYQKLFSMDFDGNVTPIQLGESNDAYETSQGVVVSRAGGEFQQLDEIGETDIEAAAEASTTDGVPHNLKMKVKIVSGLYSKNSYTDFTRGMLSFLNYQWMIEACSYCNIFTFACIFFFFLAEKEIFSML